MAKFKLTTTAQVERLYEVEGADEEQARARLRTYFKDSELLREGLVTPVPEGTRNTTPEQIKTAEGSAKPRRARTRSRADDANGTGGQTTSSQTTSNQGTLKEEVTAE